MDPQTALAIFKASLAGAEALLPVIRDLVKSGAITLDEQRSLNEQYVSLKNKADGQFSADYWQK